MNAIQARATALFIAGLAITSCTLSQDANDGLRCEADGGCPVGYECYRGFCITAGEGPTGDCAVEGTTSDCYTGPEGTVGVGICRPGQRVCESRVWSACLREITPGLEICNDLDDDCDGVTDEVDRSTCDTGLEGICAEGTLGCGDSSASCMPIRVSAEETCDGEDSDCDGAVDEHLDGACYPAGTPGCVADGEGGYTCQGVCQTGTTTCTDGVTSDCRGAITPTATTDRCTGPGELAADEDCDGMTDEGCACTPGTTQRCYTGPDGTATIGACREGTQTCETTTSGSRFGDCVGSVVPTAETCANPGVDNDCDGIVDNVPRLDDRCVVGGAQGICRNGYYQCRSSTLQCVGPSATTEVCNGIDDDCDGTLDETFNLATDERNCGACGARCGAGLTCCGGTCVDLVRSPTHCGGCGTACGAGVTCCTGMCANTQTDEMNCGACGNVCAAGSTCCGGRCVDTDSNTANCGTCGTACSSGTTCCGGTCAAPTAPACTGCPTDCSLEGRTCCSGACVDLMTSTSSCGACGRACAAGQLCCGGTCTAVGPANCGGCGVTCATGTQRCCGGVCTTIDAANCTACGVSCGAGQLCCGAGCVDVMTDEANCGRCGTACAMGETCTSGVCCGAGESVCGTTCTDLMTDEANCGRCARACSSGRTCTGGCCCDGTDCFC